MANFHYQSNLRDIEFNLFEYLKIQDTTLGCGEFKSMDENTARETLRGLQSICENELAESFVSAANPPIAFYMFGTFLALVIDALGTNEQKARYVENMIERHWGGSMVLTEPDAGSDVGAGRAKARQIEGDLYELEGVKSFITNGGFEAAGRRNVPWKRI